MKLPNVLRILMAERLSARAMLALCVLKAHGRQSMTQLAEACECTQASITSMVDRLEEGLLVARDAMIAGDRRKIEVRLTKAGLELIDQLSALIEGTQFQPEGLAA